MEDVLGASARRRAVKAGLCAVVATLIVGALSAPAAFAGSSSCGDIGRAHGIQTLSPATCADAQSLVPGYYSNPACFANGGTQPCSPSAGGKNWQCSANSGSVSCQSPDFPGSNVSGLVKWTDGPDTGTGPPISALTIAPFAFRALAAGGPVVTRGGALVTFRLRRAGKVTFGLSQTIFGRKVGPGPNGCKPQNQFNRTRPRCTTTKGRGGFTRQSTAGANQFRFSGRIANRKLPPGLYTLKGRFEAEDPVVSKGLRILPPPRR